MFKGHDWILTFIIAILCTLGTVTIYSVTYLSDPGLITKQLYILIISIVAYFSISLINYSWLKENKIITLIFLSTLFLLIFTRFFTPEIAGTNRWIEIGPLNLQPAEIAKIVVIILCAHMLGKNNDSVLKPPRVENIKLNTQIYSIDRNYLLRFIRSAFFIIPILVLIFIQPSLGNTIITFSVWAFLSIFFYPEVRYSLTLLILFAFTAFISYLVFVHSMYLSLLLIPIGVIFIRKNINIDKLSMVLVFTIAFSLIPAFNWSWANLMQDYQKTRVEAFMNPQSDPLGSGWQVKQSQIAIGSGRIFGRGFRQGTQASLGILPYAHTDFIYASFAEQFGFVGSTLLLVLLLSLPLRLFWISSQIKSLYDQILVTGVGILLLLHIFINIGMNIGKLPVTGIPLPFISYGGSSILTLMIGLGIVQNILKHNNETHNFEKILPRSGFVKYP